MSEDPKDFEGGDYNLFRYCHNDPEDHTDAMGLEGNNVSVTDWKGLHIEQELEQRELAGLDTTAERASQSAAEGAIMAQVKAASNRPDPSGYASGEPYKAERTATDYEPEVLPNDHIVVTSAIHIKVFDKNGPLAGVEVSEMKDVPILASRDLVTPKKDISGFTERTDSNGQLHNPDYWHHTFTSPNGFVTRSQTLVAGRNHLQWVGTQSAVGGMNIYTHQTGYFLQPGSPGY